MKPPWRPRRLGGVSDPVASLGRVVAPGPPPAAPRIVAGRYRLDRRIGTGAMGTVWEAYDQVLHRRVAIKEVLFPAGIPAPEAEQIADRTLREARAIGALSNPNVVTLYDIITLASGPAIVMELLPATSLAHLLARGGPLTDGQAATVGLAVSAGLTAAHAAGITHRDVKPGNVLVADDGRIKLTDFGIARTADEQPLTVTGLLLGSPAYISPEVATGRPATPTADAWGLGAMLFACVEGRPPYDRGDAIATLTAVVTDPVPSHPHSGRLGPVIDGLLTKDPARRLDISTAHALLLRFADDPVGYRLAVARTVPGASGPAAISGGVALPGGAALSGEPVYSGDIVYRDGSAGASTPGSTVGRAPGATVGSGSGPAVGNGPPAAGVWAGSGQAPFGSQGVESARAPFGPRRDGPANLRGRSDGAEGAGGHGLPPPPWDPAAARSLPPLPSVRGRVRPRPAVLVLAVVLGLVAIAAGYFGVLAMANLA